MAFLLRYPRSEPKTQQSTGNELEAKLNKPRQILEQNEIKELMEKSVGTAECTKKDGPQLEGEIEDYLEKKHLMMQLMNAENEQERLKALLDDVEKKLAQNDPIQITKAKDAAKRAKVTKRPKCLIEVNRKSFEFDEICRRFLSGTEAYKDKAKVLKVWKNEETERRDMYIKLKEKIKKELRTSNDDLVEKQLWHGSTKGGIYSICLTGFNRSFAGANANFFGDGCYFAVNPSYCIDRSFSHPDGKNVYHIILAKVLTGKSCQGEAGQRALQLGFHSGVDNLQSPNMYIVYDDYAAYPDYVISFKLKL